MRVLYVMDGTDRGERQMIIGLSCEGVEPVVICHPKGSGQAEFEAAGIRVVPLVSSGKLDIKAINRIRSLLQEQPYDLVHVFTKRMLINYTLASYGFNIPVITYRGIVGNLSYWDPFSWLSFFNPRIARWICVCEAIRTYFIEKRFLLFFRLFDPKQVVTIYKGHRLEWYLQLQGEPVLPTVGVPLGVKVIGCVARMKKRKGILELIKAMELVDKRHQAHLVLVGRVLDEDIRKACEQSPVRDHIHLLGFHPDAARMAAEFDIACLPSLRREGLPRAVIEAMAQGIAPVVTDAGGSAELIEPGLSGLVVPPGNPAALAAAFDELLSDDVKRKVMGQAAQQKIERDFSVETTRQKTLALYRDVLGC